MTAISPRNENDNVTRLFQDRNHVIVMGVVNVTPDSFSDGGKYLHTGKAVDHALKLVDEGADIIDIGGESTRPGSDVVSVDVELYRVMGVVEGAAAMCQVPISIDTYKADVARMAVSAGATIINDITGLVGDAGLAPTVAELDAGLILMHKRGNPKDMQTNTLYEDMIGEIKQFLAAAVTKATTAGVCADRIMIDPGIGFGKDLEGNLEIIRSVKYFTEIGRPVLIGASRKSFIGQITGADPDNRLPGSVAAAVAAVLNGAAAVRVHDVAATRQAVDVAVRLRQGN